MSIKDMLKKSLAAALAGQSVTLSGEIIIMNEDMSPVIADDLVHIDFDAFYESVRSVCPDVRIRRNNGICDLTIKLFATEARAMGDVCGALQEALEKFADGVYDSNLSLRVNVLGKLRAMGEEREFRFLNKREMISYKITAEEEKSFPLGHVRRRLYERCNAEEGTSAGKSDTGDE